MSENKLQAIKYADGHLQLLDQRLLPYETVYLDVPDPQAAWQQIKVRPWCISMSENVSMSMVACRRHLQSTPWCQCHQHYSCSQQTAATG
jgi:methylthioribose-1-phosphate isomerase